MTLHGTADAPAGTGPPADAEPWRRLDRRMLVVHPVVDLVKLLPVIVVILISGASSDDRWRIGMSLVAAVAVLAVGASRWFTTTYRIGADRVELRTGLLRRRHRSVHRDRIRTADLTSTLAHRALGLAVVRVGTGSRESGEDAELRLDAVGKAEAERLRALLLGQAPGPAGGQADTDTGPPEIARLRWTWIRFAPLTFSALAVVGVVWAGLLRTAEEFGFRPQDVNALRGVRGPAPIWLGGAALLATAVVGAAVVFVEGWWGYRLTRADDGGLVLRRGLLTRRSLTLEGRRIRGAELDEPLLLRLGRGARPLALTTGLRAQGEGEHVGALAPAVPRAEARRIAAAALGVAPEASVAVPLDRHPRAAGTRRLTRAVVPCLVVGLLALPLPGSPGAWWVLPSFVVLGVGLGVARWAALGHALTDTHLVVRSGAWVRRTVVLRRDGVIGWRVHQSFFQRRSGLVTLVAVTAAGRGHGSVLDVGVGRALELVEATTPGLLVPFAVRPATDRPVGSGALVVTGAG